MSANEILTVAYITIFTPALHSSEGLLLYMGKDQLINSRICGSMRIKGGTESVGDTG